MRHDAVDPYEPGVRDEVLDGAPQPRAARRGRRRRRHRGAPRTGCADGGSAGTPGPKRKTASSVPSTSTFITTRAASGIRAATESRDRKPTSLPSVEAHPATSRRKGAPSPPRPTGPASSPRDRRCPPDGPRRGRRRRSGARSPRGHPPRRGRSRTRGRRRAGRTAVTASVNRPVYAPTSRNVSDSRASAATDVEREPIVGVRPTAATPEELLRVLAPRRVEHHEHGAAHAAGRPPRGERERGGVPSAGTARAARRAAAIAFGTRRARKRLTRRFRPNQLCRRAWSSTPPSCHRGGAVGSVQAVGRDVRDHGVGLWSSSPACRRTRSRLPPSRSTRRCLAARPSRAPPPPRRRSERSPGNAWIPKSVEELRAHVVRLARSGGARPTDRRPSRCRRGPDRPASGHRPPGSRREAQPIPSSKRTPRRRRGTRTVPDPSGGQRDRAHLLVGSVHPIGPVCAPELADGGSCRSSLVKRISATSERH